MSGVVFAPYTSKAQTGPRRFEVLRGGASIGRHELIAEKSGDALLVQIRIDIEIRVLGFRAYYYQHANDETWVGGALQTLSASTDEDGERSQATVTRNGDQLLINGAPAPEASPTSYWNYANFGVRPWFSTQTGKMLSLQFSQTPGARERWDLAGDFAGALFYDEEREWRGFEFDGRGERVRYRQTAPGPQLRRLLG